VYIARAIAQRPKVIILDEPTSALDIENSSLIIDLLCRLCSDGYTTILTCHLILKPSSMSDSVSYFLFHLCAGFIASSSSSISSYVTSKLTGGILTKSL